MGYLGDEFTGFVLYNPTTEDVEIKIEAKIRQKPTDFNAMIKAKTDDIFTQEIQGKLVYGYEVATSYIIAEDNGTSIPFAVIDIIDASVAQDPQTLRDTFLDAYDIHQAQIQKFGEVIEIMKDNKIKCTISRLTL